MLREGSPEYFAWLKVKQEKEKNSKITTDSKDVCHFPETSSGLQGKEWQ